MTATNETYLPTYEELYVPPLNLTSAALRAGAPFFGKYCDLESKEFMLCKAEERDPRKCLKYNKELSACASRFFHQVRDHCAEAFTDYWMCLDKSEGGQMSYKFCRKTQAKLDECMKEKMKLERPEIGWLSKVRLFDSDRPKPVPKSYEHGEPIGVPPESIEQVPEALDSLKRTKNSRLF